MRNCPDIKIFNSFLAFAFMSFVFLLLSVLSSSFCLVVITIMNSHFGFCLFVFCPDITPIKCLKGLKCQKSLFVSKFKSGTHLPTNPPDCPRSGVELPGQLQNRSKDNLTLGVTKCNSAHSVCHNHDIYITSHIGSN